MKAPSAMREQIYDDDQICDLIEKAIQKGILVGTGRDIEDYTIGELDRLVNQVQ